MKFNENTLTLFIIFVFYFTNGQSQVTDRIEVTIQLENDTDIEEKIPIEKGNILTPKYFDNSEYLEYQVIVICNVESSKNVIAFDSGNWQVILPPNSKIPVKLICLCINKGFKPPGIETSAYFTKLALNKKSTECGCSNQQDLHDCIEETLTILLEGEKSDGHVVGLGKDRCVEAIKSAVNDLLMKIFQNQAHSIYYNKDKAFGKIGTDCSFEENDIISVGLSNENPILELLIDANNSDLNQNINKNITECFLTCDIRPCNQEGEELLSLFIQAQKNSN